MSALLQLRSAPSGVPFVGENEGDTILWDATLRLWKTGPGGGGGAVDSVFGRTGVVVAASGDYDGDQVDNVSGVTGTSVSDALDALSDSIDAVVGTGAEIDDGNSGAAKTIDFSTGPAHKLTLTATCTLTLTPPSFVRTVLLRLIQNGTGGWSIVLPAGTKSPSGLLVLTGAANSEDLLSLYWNGSVWEVTLTPNMVAIP